MSNRTMYDATYAGWQALKVTVPHPVILLYGESWTSAQIATIPAGTLKGYGDGFGGSAPHYADPNCWYIDVETGWVTSASVIATWVNGKNALAGGYSVNRPTVYLNSTGKYYVGASNDVLTPLKNTYNLLPGTDYDIWIADRTGFVPPGPKLTFGVPSVAWQYLSYAQTGHSYDVSVVTDATWHPSAGPGPSPYLIGTSTGAAAAATQVITVATATNAGDAIVVGATVNSVSETVLSVADSQSNYYGAAPVINMNAGTEYNGAAFAATSGPGGAGSTVALTTSDTITVTFSSASANAKNAIAVRVPGIVPGSSGDAAESTFSAGSATPSATTGTLQAAGEILVAFEANATAGGNIAWAPGWTSVASGLQTASNQISGAALQAVSSTAPVTASGTITSAKWTMMLLSLLTSAPPPPDPLVIPPAIPVFPAGYGPLPVDFGNWVTSTLGFQTSGIVFRAVQQAQQTFTLSGGVKTAAITFDTVLEDPYSGWQAGSNYWVAPATGIYEITVFCSIASFAVNLEVTISITGGAQQLTPFQGELSSLNLGGGSAFARVPLVGGADYVQGFVTVQAASGSPHTDVSTAGRVPTLEISYISQ